MREHQGETATPKTFDVAIIGIVGLPARYGGFETLADHLVHRLAGTCRMLVFCTAEKSASQPESYSGASLEYLPWNANGWQSVVYDGVALISAMWRSRTLLVLGVSGCLLLPMVRLLAPRTTVVTNIDGIEWRRRKWGRAARLMLRISEAFAVQLSHHVIADNTGIQDYLRRTYGRASTMIPYGGDTTQAHAQATEAPRVARFAQRSYYLTICRIEPENNIAEILQAFATTPDEPLVMVGNWHSAFARELRARYGGINHLQLLDPIYDASTLQRLRTEARGYVHGHSAGGTNPSLVEAMFIGLAVLAFDVEYNRHTMGGDGYYWTTPAELAEIVSSLDDANLYTEAARLQSYARENYTWTGVCNQYARLLQVPLAPE